MGDEVLISNEDAKSVLTCSLSSEASPYIALRLQRENLGKS